MTNIALLALEASDATVVITSVALVFGMLVALCLIITLEGKIFDAISVKKNPPKAPKAASASKAAAPAPKPAAPKAEAPVQAAAGGIPGEKVGCVVHPNMDLLKEMNKRDEDNARIDKQFRSLRITNVFLMLLSILNVGAVSVIILFLLGVLH